MTRTILAIYKSEITLTLKVTVLSALLISCSSLETSKEKSEKNITLKDSKKYSKKIKNGPSDEEVLMAMEAAEKRLEEVVIEAHKTGSNAIKFLSTNLFLKANEASKAGDYSSSSLIYKYVLKLKPEDAYVALKYGVDLIRVGKVTEAEEVLKKYYPDSGVYEEKFGMLIAGINTSFQKFNEAQKIYKSLVKKYPKNIEACIFLSRSYSENPFGRGIAKEKPNVLSSGDWKAIKLLDKCEKHNKDEGIFSYYKGKVLLKRNQITKSIRSFKHSLKVEPVFYQSAVALGMIYEDQGKFKKAEKVYENLLQKWSSNRVILSRMVQNLLAQEKFIKVLGYAEQLSALDSEDLNLKVKLGILYTDAGKYSKAIKTFKSIIEIVPESDKVLYYLGAIYQELGDFENSITFFSKVDEESALFFDSSVQVTSMLSKMALGQSSKPFHGHSRKPSSEKRVLSPSLEMKIKFQERLFSFIDQRKNANTKLEIELLVLKAQYFEFKNELEKSISILSSLADKKEFNDSQRYYLATIYDKAKYYEESVKQAKIIVENDPENAHAHNFIGYSYLERSKDFENAYKYINRALEINPDDAYIRDSLGWYYFQKGEFKKSLIELKKAFASLKTDKVITQHLGQVYLALRKYEKARLFFEKALTLTTGESEKKEIKDAISKIKEFISDKSRKPANKK